MLRFIILLVAFLLFAIQTEGLQTRPCSKGQPQPTRVLVNNCCEMPCKVIRGQNISILMMFNTTFSSQTLRYEKVATSLGVIGPGELPPEQVNACDWLSGSSCPVSAGQSIISTLSWTTRRILPLLTFAQEVSVLDEQDRTVTCFEFDVEVLAD
ncbi:uncharacterized protein LOC118456913 [Anopheles albimanus]|uniref:MD-2-related lipid-recognition domain-containing protein n=1 Tax=Anopheles albimanus TaxID=7167 RepID=A0A182FR19_ANOAL|nr:uncharacterized protein LOC118456913 [Anopheles albimanus]